MESVRLCYLSIFGEPGSYDPATFETIEGGDNECIWFNNTFDYLPGVSIEGTRICQGEAIPEPGDGDLFVLGGSFNSVHDGLPWQTAIYRWLEKLWTAEKPLLAICGGHQMVSHLRGANVDPLPGDMIAGTETVNLNSHGLASPLFAGLGAAPKFHFGNHEHVAQAPAGATLLGSHQKAGVAALDYGGGWYSTQFHPESKVETFKTYWRGTEPEIVENYAHTGDGFRLIENFVGMARA